MASKSDITQLVGNTPLVRLNRLSDKVGVDIYAKCEFANPTGSVKDRAALFMLRDAKSRGLLKSGTTIIEPTSGNTGIALAAMCASMGIDLILTMPESMSVERRKLLAYYGAKLELTPAAEGMMGAIKRADELNASIANSIILAQFDNPANPLAHYEGTGVEILESGIELDAFVAAVGTGGSISGTAKRLRESIEDLRVFAVEPIKSAVLSGEGASSHGIQGIGAGFVPQVCDTSIYDEIVKVSDEDAYEMARLLAKDEGLLVGISAGANVWASLQVAQRGEFKSIVTILPDTGERYLSTKLFDL